MLMTEFRRGFALQCFSCYNIAHTHRTQQSLHSATFDYSGTLLIWTLLEQKKVSLLAKCPDFRGWNVYKQGVWDSEMRPVYQGVSFQSARIRYKYMYMGVGSTVASPKY